MRLLGAVLAGGRSRRFGSDKAAAMLDGRRLLDHAAVALAAHCDDLVVVGRADAAYVSIADAPASGLGPLGGLCAALLHAGVNGFDAVLMLPCDVPALPAEVASALIADCPAVVASQPVVGCWPASLGKELEDYLRSDQRRAMQAWVDHADAARIVSGPLANINLPADLQSLR
jgi:molybdopterin-guanine dinucleotide biosynthesis protein A